MDTEKKTETEKKLFRVKIETFTEGEDEDTAEIIYYQILNWVNVAEVVKRLNGGY